MKPPEISAYLRTLAERIDANAERPFGGLFVVIPPDAEADSVLLLEGKPDSAMFVGLVTAKIEMVKQLHENELRKQGRIR